MSENNENNVVESKTEKISIGESAKILFGRAGRKLKGAAVIVKDSAVTAAGVVKDSTSSVAGSAVSAAKSVTEDVVGWRPKAVDFRSVVQKAKEANTLDDICQRLLDLQGLEKFLAEEKEALCLKAYTECPHEKVVKVKGEVGVFTAASGYKLCLKCCMAEEGGKGDLTSSHFRLVADGQEMPRKEADKLVMRMFSQEEVLKFKND